MSKVNHPKHYNAGKFEVIDVIEDWKLDFHLGNTIKYIARSEHKENQIEDLEKAKWYLERKIENLKKRNKLWTLIKVDLLKNQAQKNGCKNLK